MRAGRMQACGRRSGKGDRREGRAVIEFLERRQLLSDAAGSLHLALYGTDGDDVITVKPAYPDLAVKLADPAGVCRPFFFLCREILAYGAKDVPDGTRFSNVASIEIHGGPGNDRIEVEDLGEEWAPEVTLYGGEGDDTLIASGARKRVLVGGPGNDLLRGCFPHTTGLRSIASYADSPSGVEIRMQPDSPASTMYGAGTAKDGFGGTDTLEQIGMLEGSDFDDVIYGAQLTWITRIDGRAGNDLLVPALPQLVGSLDLKVYVGLSPMLVGTTQVIIGGQAPHPIDGAETLRDVYAQTGILRLDASPGDDNIVVKPGPDVGEVLIYGVPGLPEGTLATGVQGIQVYAGAGDDRVELQAGIRLGQPSSGAVLNGGDGDDILISQITARFRPGRGNDVVEIPPELGGIVDLMNDTLDHAPVVNFALGWLMDDGSGGCDKIPTIPIVMSWAEVMPWADEYPELWYYGNHGEPPKPDPAALAFAQPPSAATAAPKRHKKPVHKAGGKAKVHKKPAVHRARVRDVSARA